jgi:hypothetical protein
MKEVVRTHQQSVADAAKVALEAEGIEAVLFDEHALASIGLAGEIRVMVPDAALKHACAIVAKLESSRVVPEAPRSWSWQRPALILLVACVVLLFVTAIASDSDLPKPFIYGLISLSAISGLLGLVLLLIGMVIATREQLQEGREDSAS